MREPWVKTESPAVRIRKRTVVFWRQFFTNVKVYAIFLLNKIIKIQNTEKYGKLALRRTWLLPSELAFTFARVARESKVM